MDPLVIVSSRQDQSWVVFGEGGYERVRACGKRRILIADARLRAWSEAVARRIDADAVFSVDVDESQKTLATVERLYEWMGQSGVTRDTTVVALGGGVATDMVGFAAATYQRGLTWCAVPTSLLAQVDAAIGGKTGVNTAWGKNLVGAFHLPRVVVVDVEFLGTLPRREWLAGLGEVLKSGLIRGGALYERLDGLRLPPEGSLPAWRDVIFETAAIKTEIVNEDLYETGSRMFLNFGHTIGHALENLLGYGVLSHGEAVGLGALAALELSEKLCGLSPAVQIQVRKWMSLWGLPTAMPAIDFDLLWRRLRQDKKARTDGLTWVLVEAPGKPRLWRNIPEDLVRAVISNLALP